MSVGEFLRRYRDSILNLPIPEKYAAGYLSSLKVEEQAIFATLLPTAAAIKRRSPDSTFRELFQETTSYCLNAIEAVSE
jgi:hypothetical protein